MAIGIIDYAASYFKYKTPTPMRGEPTNKALKRLQSKLQANAISIETDLGGGNHGCLALVLADAEHNSIPNTQPFVAPAYPPPLVTPSTATAVKALELEEACNEQKQLCLECENVEKALLRFIQDAVEDKHAASLVDAYTNLFKDDVPAAMGYLNYNYGKVRCKEAVAKEAEVMATAWQPSDPIVLLTRPIENLQKLATQADNPCSDKQLLEKGLSIIRDTRDFECALIQWEKKAEADKTWASFKTHFHEAQLNLKKTHGPTMVQAGFHHANMLAKQLNTSIEQQISSRDSELLALLQNIPGLSANSTDSTSSDEDSPHEHQANATSSNTVQLEILKLLKELSEDIKQTKAAVPKRCMPRKTPDGKAVSTSSGHKQALLDSRSWEPHQQRMQPQGSRAQS